MIYLSGGKAVLPSLQPSMPAPIAVRLHHQAKAFLNLASQFSAPEPAIKSCNKLLISCETRLFCLKALAELYSMENMQYLACLKEWLSLANDGIILTISLLVLRAHAISLLGVGAHVQSQTLSLIIIVINDSYISLINTLLNISS